MSLEEVRELRRIVEELAREVERLREEVRSKPAAAVEEREPEEVGGGGWGPLPDYMQAIFKVLEEHLGEKEDAGMVFVGGIERRGGRVVDSFFSGIDLEDVLKTPPSRVVDALSPLTSENRVRILLSLLKGAKTASELVKETGLEGGPLYHHLKELVLAGYVESPGRGRYTLTSKGCIAIRVAAALASIPGMATPRVERMEEEFKREELKRSSK